MNNNYAEIKGKFTYIFSTLLDSFNFLLLIVQTYRFVTTEGEPLACSKSAITGLLFVCTQTVAGQNPYLHKQILHHNCYWVNQIHCLHTLPFE